MATSRPRHVPCAGKQKRLGHGLIGQSCFLSVFPHWLRSPLHHPPTLYTTPYPPLPICSCTSHWLCPSRSSSRRSSISRCMLRRALSGGGGGGGGGAASLLLPPDAAADGVCTNNREASALRPLPDLYLPSAPASSSKSSAMRMSVSFRGGPDPSDEGGPASTTLLLVAVAMVRSSQYRSTHAAAPPVPQSCGEVAAVGMSCWGVRAGGGRS